ncbi:pyridoxamine 5'-phosphate oxidase family protein [Candidatus Nitrosocosmicus sp. R]
MWGDLDKSQIDDLLKSELIGRVGCFDGNKVYVVPITYAYDNGYIYGHTILTLLSVGLMFLINISASVNRYDQFIKIQSATSGHN